jgi:PhoU domain
MTDHIVKAYDQDISSLKTMLAQMGGLAEEQLDNAIIALSKRDVALADQVIMRDEKLDNLEREIEEKAILTIAKRQPMALDLRDPTLSALAILQKIPLSARTPFLKLYHGAYPRASPAWAAWPRRSSKMCLMPMPKETMPQR